MNYLLPHMVENSAERFPDREAFRCGNESITYQQLAGRVVRLSRMLAEKGVKKGDRVGVLLNTGIDSAVAVYGIMNSGAAYVPLDPTSPPARIRFLLADCGIDVLVSDDSQANKLSETLSKDVVVRAVIGVTHDSPAESISWDEVSKMPTHQRGLEMNSEDLAYIMYTSGTTGLPKGIMHTHRSGLSYARLSKSLYQINAEDRLGSHSALHFDISTLGFFTMPLAGGTTVIIPEAHKSFPASLSQLIETERLTIWYSVPLALLQLLKRGVLAERKLDSLRWVLFGGEPFPAKHVRELMRAWPNAGFSNIYGPAEVNQCTYYNLFEPPTADAAIPLGTAWDDTRIIIVDPDDNLVNVGETGEILVQTPTMMSGYWCQPDLTEESLFRLKNDSGNVEVFYRTGDLAFENEEGNLMFQGRQDRQIKTRGFRVELDEIEAVLLNHKSADEAAVFSYRGNDNEVLIAAAIVTEQGIRASKAEIREYLMGRLPSYSIPFKICYLDALPRTTAGKIDYGQVKKMETEERKFEAGN